METKRGFFGGALWGAILSSAAVMRGEKLPHWERKAVAGNVGKKAEHKQNENGASGTGKYKRTTTRRTNHPSSHRFKAIQKRAHKRRLKAHLKATNKAYWESRNRRLVTYA